MVSRSHSSKRQRYLFFHLGDGAYAVPTDNVDEILPMAELVPAPGGPTLLGGFLNLSGDFLAVVAGRRLLGLPDRPRDIYTPLVILRSSGERLALEVDDVTCVAPVADDAWVPISKGCSLNECATAIARVEGEAIVLLSPERILLDQERKRMAQWAELARRRIAEVTS
jgi:purine-binding chemotaxis protein CheW